MAERNSSKRVRLADVDDCDEPASKRHRVSTGAEVARPDTAASTLRGAGSSTSNMNTIGGDSFGAISGGINGGRNNTYYVLSGEDQESPRLQLKVPEALKQAIAPSAFHNSGARGDPPRCHPNTRVAIQNKIMNWVRGLDPETKDCAVMWLYGPAGSGKTAIAQTIAEMLFELKMLLASFFFARADPSRNCSRFLVATIAYQLALCLPAEVARRIYAVVSRDPHVFQLSLQAQIAFLLVEPLQPLIESGYFDDDGSTRAVVIDGLDECIDPKEQVDILRSLSAALRKHWLPIRVFVASRPEIEIKDSFNSNVMNSSSTRLALADDYQADSDIKHFLSDEFQNIKQTHMLGKNLPAEWPSDETMRHLLRKSSGQFIYASTVVKFVKSKRHNPDERLRIVLGLRPPGKDLPFADLDALYRHLFSTVDDWEKVSLILAFCILRSDSSRFSTDVIEALLGFGPGYCCFFLCDLGSIIDLDKIGSRLTFFHASIQDFLLDQTRSKEFYIDPLTWHVEITRLLFQFFQTSSPCHWEADCMKRDDLTILKPHIEQCLSRNLQELEGEFLSFDVLRFFDAQFSPRLAYSIPDYLSIINNSRLEGATAIYRKQEHAFYEHLKKELRGYGESPFVDFFLLCICSDDFFGAHGPILMLGGEILCLFPPMRDSLWVEAGWTDARRSYIEALKVAAKEIISEQSERRTVTSAALYALKEASVILAQKGLDYDDPHWVLKYDKERFFLDTCNHLLEKAAQSEDLINCAQDLACPLILDHHACNFPRIDTAIHNYLMRMGIEPKRDYAFLSHHALMRTVKMVTFDDTQRGSDNNNFFWTVETFKYLQERAGQSEDLINDIQNLDMSLVLDHNPWAVGYIDTATRCYLTRIGATSKQDYASLSRQALMKVSELAIMISKHYTKEVDIEIRPLISCCQYLVKHASPSQEFIDFLQSFQRHLWKPGYLKKTWLVKLDRLIYDYLAGTDKAADLDYISSAYCALELFYWMSAFREDSLQSHDVDIEYVVKHCTQMLEKAGRSKNLITYTPDDWLCQRSLYPQERQIIKDALEDYRKRMGDDESRPFIPCAVDAWGCDSESNIQDQDTNQE